MNIKIESPLKNFFCHLVAHIKTWEKCMDRAKKPVKVFYTQANDFRHVLRAQWEGDVLNKLPDLKCKLFHKMRCSMEKELALLDAVVKDLEKANRELEDKMEAVEKGCFNEEVSGATAAGCMAPGLDTLLEYAEDTVRHFQILFAFLQVNYEDEECAENLRKAFSPEIKNERIKEVLRSTHYFREDPS